MARYFTEGWELGGGGHAGGAVDRDQAASVGTVTIGQTHVRSGSYSLRAPPGAANSAQYGSFWDATDLPNTHYFRWWVFVAAGATTDQAKLIQFSQGGSPFTDWVTVVWRTAANGGPGVQLKCNGIGLQGSVAPITPGDGKWHSIEVSIKFGSGASDDSVTLKVDGTTVATVTNQTITTAMFDYLAFGNPSGDATLDTYWDDFAYNDSTGTAENAAPARNGRVLHLVATSDDAVGSGWQKPGGATTGLWSSIDNKPPVGIADSTSAADAEKQIRNATSTTTANYDMEIRHYDRKGVHDGESVKLVRSFANTGSSSATATNGAIQIISNPTEGAETTFNYAGSGATAGAFPTGWRTATGPYVYSPALNVHDGATSLRIGKRTATTNVALIDQAGIQAETDPGNFPYVVDQAAASSGSAVTSLAAPALPPATNVDDVVLLFVSLEKNTTMPVVTTPTGFAETGTPAATTDGVSHLYWRKYDGTWSSPTVSWDVGAFPDITLVVLRGTHLSSPVAAVNGWFDTTGPDSTAKTVTAPANSLLLAFHMNTWGQFVNSLSGWGRLSDDLEQMIFMKSQAAAGASGDAAFTVSGTHPEMTLMVAIQPPGAGAALTQAINDTVALADAVVKGPGKVLAEAVALADALVKGPGKVLTDAPALADALSLGPGKVIADTAALAESLSNAVTKAVDDPVALADSVAVALGRAAQIDDSAGVADALALEAGKVLADPVLLADALVFHADWQRTLDDVVQAFGGVPFGSAPFGAGPYGGYELSFDVGHSESEAIGVVDAVSQAIGAVLADVLGLADAIGRAVGRVLADALIVADSAQLGVGKQVDDALPVADGLSFGYGLAFSDVVALADSVETFSAFAVDVADDVELSDSLRTLASYHADLVEALPVDDDLRRDVGKLVDDAVALGDAIDTAANHHRVLQEHLAVHDAAATAANYVRVLSDNLAVFDVVWTRHGWHQQLADGIAVLDDIGFDVREVQVRTLRAKVGDGALVRADLGDKTAIRMDVGHATLLRLTIYATRRD